MAPLVALCGPSEAACALSEADLARCFAAPSFEGLRLRGRPLRPRLCDDVGVGAEVLWRLARLGGFRLNFTHLPGNETDELRALRSGVADVALSFHSINPQRVAEFDFSVPLSAAGYGFILANPGYALSIASFVTMFQPLLWAAMGGSLFAFTAILTLNRRLSWEDKQRGNIATALRRSFLECCQAFGGPSFLGDYWARPDRRCSRRLLLSFLGLFLILTFSLFQSFILGKIVGRTDVSSIRSTRDLIREMRLGRAIVVQRSWTFSYFRQGHDPIFAALRAELLRHPKVVLPSDPTDAVRLLSSDPRLVAPISWGLCFDVFDKAIVASGCGRLLLSADPDSRLVNSALIFRKGSAWAPRISGLVLAHYEPLRIVKDQREERDLEKVAEAARCAESSSREPLSLLHLAVVFIVLGIGTVTGVTVVAAECWFYNTTDRISMSTLVLLTLYKC